MDLEEQEQNTQENDKKRSKHDEISCSMRWYNGRQSSSGRWSVLFCWQLLFLQLDKAPLGFASLEKKLKIVLLKWKTQRFFYKCQNIVAFFINEYAQTHNVINMLPIDDLQNVWADHSFESIVDIMSSKLWVTFEERLIVKLKYSGRNHVTDWRERVINGTIVISTGFGPQKLNVFVRDYLPITWAISDLCPLLTLIYQNMADS